jgi:uncharacterized damage-inducible protein DinB
MSSPIAGTYPAYFERYVDLVQADSVSVAVDKYNENLIAFFKNVPGEKVNYRYAEGKWTIKEMLQHIIAYRALRIARADKTALPGFDEKDYAAAAGADARSWESLLAEFEAVRNSTDLLLKSFTPNQLQRTGTTNDHPNTAVAISFMVFGHILHHINIVKERYL